jgi:hypothetical protein
MKTSLYVMFCLSSFLLQCCTQYNDAPNLVKNYSGTLSLQYVCEELNLKKTVTIPVNIIGVGNISSGTGESVAYSADSVNGTFRQKLVGNLKIIAVAGKDTFIGEEEYALIKANVLNVGTLSYYIWDDSTSTWTQDFPGSTTTIDFQGNYTGDYMKFNINAALANHAKYDQSIDVTLWDYVYNLSLHVTPEKK